MTTPTKCWIIEQGSYSDYRVVGIFTTLAYAEQALAYMNTKEQWDTPEIAERVLNPAVTELNEGLKQYTVTFCDEDVVCKPNIGLDYDVDSQRIRNGNICYRFHLWARDPNGAIKIGAERRAQLQAGIIAP
jgi:hypothetical protein